MTQYQIKFTAGENQGTVYPLSPGQAVSIGRSHSNTIRVSAPDVSGKHIIIRLRGALITVEVLSSRITKLDGNAVSIGDMLDEATAVNENDENQVASTQMTISPKILIQFTTPGEFHIEVRVPAKRIVTSTGEAEQDLSVDAEGQEIDDGQQELPGINPDEPGSNQ